MYILKEKLNMKIKIIQTDSITKGLNNKVHKPYEYGYKNRFIEHNHIVFSDANSKISRPYKQYMFLSGMWLKWKYYIDLNVVFTDNNICKETYTGKNFIYNVLLMVKFTKWFDYIAKIGGWFGLLLTIKELFF